MFDYQKFGQDVKAYRKENKLTRQEMADITGLSTHTLDKIENGGRVHLQNIHAALKIIKRNILEYYKEPS